MARALAAGALAVLALLCLVPTASADPIPLPGTEVQILDLGPTAADIAPGPAVSRTVSVIATARATAPSVVPALLAAGAIIVIGFAASLLFERTRVQEVLFLILLGLFLGPIATGLLGIVVVSPDILSAITPYVAAVALMIIL